MPLKIFIGSLSFNTTEEGLRRRFQRYGTITGLAIMRGPIHMESWGYGWITYSNEQSASRAIDDNVGHSFLDNARIRVTYARTQSPIRPYRGFRPNPIEGNIESLPQPHLPTRLRIRDSRSRSPDALSHRSSHLHRP
ncbi:RNA-binding domain-containing protein [Ascobolus immersus RN42]|uniref:RNA-binding domain-containing protein n=1 Tax=Ascobolus immersus RN42 TaxID=1160509 RepID=A0A3N4IL01_ASCIM|nr:RNA-binding domain-containing protein [Ascobolus immersus RN42]